MAIVISGNGIDMGNNPVSNASQIEVQEEQVSPYNGFKNYIINGNFDVWQRGTSQTVSGYGSDDRWINQNIGSTKTHSQIACTDDERVLFNASKFSRTVVTSVAGAGNVCLKLQEIEDVTRLAGKTVTLSFWAKADSNKNIAIEFYQNFGTGGAPSSYVTGIGSQLVALTPTWQKKTITVTIPTIVGKTLGTDGVHTSYTGMIFWFDAGSSFSSRVANLGQQSGTFDIAQVQLEEGSVATPFEQRPYGLELSLCQRYYEVGYALIIARAISATSFTSSGHSYFVPKRIIPTLSFSNIGFVGGILGTINVLQNRTNLFSVNSTDSSNMTTGQAVYTAFFYSVDAEL